MLRRTKKKFIILGTVVALSGVWGIATMLVNSALDREERKEIAEYQQDRELLAKLAEEKKNKVNSMYHLDIEDDKERSIQFTKDYLDVECSPYKNGTFELGETTYSDGTIDVVVTKGDLTVNANCYEGTAPDKFWKYGEFTDEENFFFNSSGRYTYRQNSGMSIWEVVYENRL